MRIYICGDSTAASYTQELAPLTGWGQVLGEYLPGVEIMNHAMAGRSTKSFLSEGRFQKVEEEIREGDLMLIQFSHNDGSDLVWRHTDPWGSFMNHLFIFVDSARLYGAVPVLLTPICVRSYQDHVLQESLGEYPEAVRVAARIRQVPLIDVYAKSREMLTEMGEEESLKLYMQLDPGVWPGYPDGQKDNTHTQLRGARAYAGLVADGLKGLKLI